MPMVGSILLVWMSCYKLSPVLVIFPVLGLGLFIKGIARKVYLITISDLRDIMPE